MTRRILGLALALILGAALYYTSRFWTWQLWSRDGLLGIDALRPQGGLVSGWLRGTGLAPFELLVWAVGGFLVLTAAQRLFDRFGGGDE